jgi:hypothetical protein
LGPALRFELLLRDAAAAWGIAFSPALTFSLEGLSAEEPMGPQWGRHFANREKRYSDWFTPRAQEPSWSDFLGAWNRSNLPPAPSLPELGPGKTYLVAGLSVLPSLSSAFAARSDLDWARQVRVISADPCERQLSGIAAIYAGAAKAAPLIDPTAADPTLTDPTSPAGANPPRSTGRPSGILVLGADATPAARAFLGA